MVKKDPLAYGPTFISGLLILMFIIYIVMVYPGERVELLNYGNTRVDVSIENLDFVPEIIEIEVDNKIVWKNRDNVKHTITFAEFESGVLYPGETYSHTFEDTGIYVYSCEFYPSAVGTVIVK